VALPAAGRRTSLLLARLLLTAGGAIIDRYRREFAAVAVRPCWDRQTDGSFVIDTFFVIRRDYMLPRVKVKGKVFPYSLPSVGPGADPGVQAVSPQVT